MKGKAALLVGLATGYVLGTRDGRGRYEQIKTQATRLVQDPRVQQTASQATDLAKDKAPVLKDKLASATSTVTSKATGKVPGRGGSGSQSTLDDGAIIVTAPPSGPLDPAPTSTGAGSGDLHG